MENLHQVDRRAAVVLHAEAAGNVVAGAGVRVEWAVEIHRAGDVRRVAPDDHADRCATVRAERRVRICGLDDVGARTHAPLDVEPIGGRAVAPAPARRRVANG
jgi:hypothetical protein